MKCNRSSAALLFAPLILVGCGGGGGGGATTPDPGQTVPPLVTQSYAFPSGDATSTNGTAWDIVGLKTTLSGTGHNALGNSYDMLRVDVVFAQDISNALPAPGHSLDLPTQLGVRLAIDSDGLATTGYTGSCASQGTNSVLPFEFTSDQGNFPQRLLDGNYSILSNNQVIYSGQSNPTAEAVTAVNGNMLSLSFNLTTLGVFAGKRAPKIGVSAAAFNGAGQGATDCVPTASSGAIEVFTTTM
ncbi:MAG: hypothetical protein NVSMB21_15830 [Vulcanimicrobiaceae bacterium]